MTPDDTGSGQLALNLAAFGRTLRRAGVPVDSARIALSARAALLVGLSDRQDFSAALEAVLISREQDRLVFRELFDAFFQARRTALESPAQMVAAAQGAPELRPLRPRVGDALAPRQPKAEALKTGQDPKEPAFDAAMTASDLQHLRQADFNQLSASEYALVERLARDIALPLPAFASRRTQAGGRGAQMHWGGVLRSAVHTGGEVLLLPRRRRRDEPLPLLVLLDVSGSMERYARLLLAFLHAATRRHPRRDVFAFGTRLTDLTPSFRLTDTDQMLTQAGHAIEDFAGGTRLGQALARLRQEYRSRFVGRRTVVLLVSDGLDTGDPQALGQELAWVKRHCRSLLWLNPLLRFEGYAPLARGARQLHRHADGMLAVHNLSRLQDLAASLAALLRHRH